MRCCHVFVLIIGLSLCGACQSGKNVSAVGGLKSEALYQVKPVSSDAMQRAENKSVAKSFASDEGLDQVAAAQRDELLLSAPLPQDGSSASQAEALSKVLPRIEAFLQQNSQASISVEALCSDSGRVESSKLSHRRAYETVEYLADTLGLSAARVMVEDAGSGRAIALNTTESGPLPNRQLRIRLQDNSVHAFAPLIHQPDNSQMRQHDSNPVSLPISGLTSTHTPPTNTTLTAIPVGPPSTENAQPATPTETSLAPLALPKSEQSQQPISSSEAAEPSFTVTYATGQIDSDKLPEIQAVATLLQNNPDYEAVLEGFTDNIGDPENNLLLSHQRALALKIALIKHHGIDVGRLHVKAHGQANPVADNATPAGREQNRRVAIRLVRKTDETAPLAREICTQSSLIQDTPRPQGDNSAAETQPSAPKSVSRPEEKQTATARQTQDDAVEQPQIASTDQASILQTPMAENVSYAPLHNPGNKRYRIEISVSKCTLWLYEIQADGSLRLIRPYRVATAQKGTPYPIGEGEITAIEFDPWWYPTENMKRQAARKGQRLQPVPPGLRSNPMGAFKIHLSHENNGGAYRIHGTNKPSMIGKRVSKGCIRMLNDEGKEMATMLPVGTVVNIQF